MLVGYARVSSKEQNLARQVEELEKYGCEKIFTEKHSGKNFKDRKIYNEMKEFIRSKDVLVVHDLSRFGRNKEEIKNEWQFIINKEVDIVILNMPILNTTQYKQLEGVGQLVSDIVLNLLSWLVEEERERIKTAQREGIEIAKREKKYVGRKIKYHANAVGKDKIIYDEIIKLLSQETSVMNIYKQTGVSRNTIYRIRKEVKDERNDT